MMAGLETDAKSAMLKTLPRMNLETTFIMIGFSHSNMCITPARFIYLRRCPIFYKWKNKQRKAQKQPKQSNVDHCPNSPQSNRDHYQNSQQSSGDHCQNSQQSAVDHCSNSQQSTRDHCPNCQQSTGDQCPNSPQSTGYHCPNSQQSTGDHCPDVQIQKQRYNPPTLQNLWPFTSQIYSAFLVPRNKTFHWLIK